MIALIGNRSTDVAGNAHRGERRSALRMPCGSVNASGWLFVFLRYPVSSPRVSSSRSTSERSL